jgi:chromosome segregation ATPase
MSILKRILLYVGMVTSSIILLLCLVGIIGVWAINKPATETILRVLAPIDAALERVEGISNRSATTLTEVSVALDTAEARVQQMGNQISEANLVLETISMLVGQDVRPKIDSAADSIRAVYDTLAAIEEAIDSFNAIPFVGLAVPGSEEVAQLRTGMEDAAVEVNTLIESSQQKKVATVAEVVDRVTGSLERIRTRVEGIEARVGELDARVGRVREEIAGMQNQVPLWIDISSAVATLLLAWLIFSQVAVFVLCLKHLQGKIS